jgi:CRP-like cAMP-binding protein
MVIDKFYLISAGAEFREYKSGEFIFYEGDPPLYYYQIIEGRVKLNNFMEDGNELIQNIITEGNCFGESLLFLQSPYPMNAVSLTSCVIMRICKQNFFGMLDVYPILYQNVCFALSNRVYNNFCSPS